MNVPLLLGSLAAVLMTAGLVGWLGLGRGRAIAEDEARRLAEELLFDFDAGEVFADRDGRAALVAGTDGSFALLRLHGAHPVARRLAAPLTLRRNGEAVMVGSGEARFGETAIVNDRLLTLV